MLLSLRGGKISFESLTTLCGDRIRFRARQFTQFQQMLEVSLPNRLAFGNRAVKERLSERGLVALIMAQAAVTVHIYDDIPLELVAKVHSQAHNLSNRFRVFAVDVKNRDLQRASKIRRIGG